MLANSWRNKWARLLMFAVQKMRVIFYRQISNLEIQGRPIRYQPLHAVGLGVLKVDKDVRFGVHPSPGFLSGYAYLEARNPETSIVIGEKTWINNGFCAIAEHSKIVIGARCLIGANCEITDSDFHGLNVEDRLRSLADWARPVVIEDDVFLGANVKILKGVTIGYGSVVANSAVVTRDIPPLTVSGGNPARVIKTLASATPSSVAG